MRVLVGVLFVALVTACSQPPPPAPTTAEELAGALTKAARAKSTYRVKLTPKSGEGVTTPGTALVRLTGDRTADVELTSLRVVQNGQPPEQLKYVSKGDQTFVLLPPVFELPLTKSWVQLKRTDGDEFTNTMLGFYDIAAQQVLFTQYQLPIIAAGGVLKSTNGSSYTVEVDVAKASAAITDEALKQEIAVALEGVTTFTAVIDVADGLPKRITVTTPKDGKQLVDEAIFDGWGEDVTINAPDSSQVSPRR